MKIPSNHWLTRIGRVVGEPDGQRAVQALVTKFRPSNESLEVIALKLGIEQITIEPLPFDGGVFEESGQRTIKINSLAPLSRQRFTLAHELGHVILERSVKGSPSCQTDDALERACNCIAAELLMPADETRKIVNHAGRAVAGETGSDCESLSSFPANCRAKAL